MADDSLNNPRSSGVRLERVRPRTTPPKRTSDTSRSRRESTDSDDAIRAAGVVLWRPGRGDFDEPELALIHRPKWCDWSFPKGKLEAGERSKDAARRETLEETGMRVELCSRLPTRHYLAKGRPKRVRYWAAVRIVGGFTPNQEVDRLEWLPASQARRRLSYEHDRPLVDALLSQLCPEGR